MKTNWKILIASIILLIVLFMIVLSIYNKTITDNAKRYAFDIDYHMPHSNCINNNTSFDYTSAMVNEKDSAENDIDTIRPELDIVDSHHAAELIVGIPQNAKIIGRWMHKGDDDTLTIYKECGRYYVAFRQNLKWFLVFEVKSHYWEKYRAFTPIERPLGDRAESYYRIVDGRLLVRPCDGSGGDYWYEPLE